MIGKGKSGSRCRKLLWIFQVHIIRGGHIRGGNISLFPSSTYLSVSLLSPTSIARCLLMASLTGESEQVCVDQTQPFLLSAGCKVDDGGYMAAIPNKISWWQQLLFLSCWVSSTLLASKGDQQLRGSSSQGRHQHPGEETPLQIRRNGVDALVGQVGLIVAAVLVLMILIIFYCVGHEGGSNNSGNFQGREQTSGNCCSE